MQKNIRAINIVSNCDFKSNIFSKEVRFRNKNIKIESICKKLNRKSNNKLINKVRIISIA